MKNNIKTSNVWINSKGISLLFRTKRNPQKSLPTALRDCPFIVIFLAIIRPHAFRRNVLSGMRSNFWREKEKTLENQAFSRVWWTHTS